MKLQKGDKVRFLNESIEGTVSGTLNQGRVEVIDSHGFTRIAQEVDLVKVEFGLMDQIGNPYIQREESSVAAEKKVLQKPVSIFSIVQSIEEDDTIYAAVHLKDETKLLTTDIDLYLVNNGLYTIAYTCSRQSGDLRSGVDAGILKPRSEKIIGVFSQDELHRFSGFEFQFLFFNSSEFRPRVPIVKSFHISSSDFVDPEYRETLKGKEDSVMMMPLYAGRGVQDVDVTRLLEKFKQQEDEEKMRKQFSGKEKVKGEKFVFLSREKIVDLHIEELVKDFSDMSNAQIVAYQINYFLYELDQAIVNKFHKITFIHGVGHGILKSAIREELKNYSNLRYRDAPPEKFGYGATEVEIL